MVTTAVLPPSIGISQLHPDLDGSATSVTGIVTLVWPYASTTQSSSLLLVEKDFRLRRHRGQVRIHFNGACAKAIAQSSISSGDRLSLSLVGAVWAKDVTAANTPGKGIEWELRYDNRVLLKVIHGAGEPILLDFDQSKVSPRLTSHGFTPRQPSVYNSHIPVAFRSPLPATEAWQSPAFLKRTHLLASEYDPFTEVDHEFPDNDRRKRIKFGRTSSQWRFAERTPSPVNESQNQTFESPSPSRVQVHQEVLIEKGDIQVDVNGEQSARPSTNNYIEQTKQESLAADLRHELVQEDVVASPSMVVEAPPLQKRSATPSSQESANPQDAHRRKSTQSLDETSPIGHPPTGANVSNAQLLNEVADETGMESDIKQKASDEPPASPEADKIMVDNEPSPTSTVFKRPLIEYKPSATELASDSSQAVVGSWSDADVGSDAESTGHEQVSRSVMNEGSELDNNDAATFSGPISNLGFDGDFPSRQQTSPEKPLSKKYPTLSIEENHVDVENAFSLGPAGDTSSTGGFTARTQSLGGSPMSPNAPKPELSPPVIDDRSQTSHRHADGQNTNISPIASPLPFNKPEDVDSSDSSTTIPETPPGGEISGFGSNQAIDLQDEGDKDDSEGATTQQAPLVQSHEILPHEGDDTPKLKESKSTDVEIIDLESEDEEDIILNDSAEAQRQASVPDEAKAEETTIGSPQASSQLVDSVERVPKISQLETSSLSLPRESRAVSERLGLEAEQPSLVEASRSSEAQDTALLAKAYHVDSARHGPEAVTSRPVESSRESKTDQDSFVGLPSTVQDSVERVPVEDHPLTPDTTQSISFVSQPSSISLQSAQVDDTLPTPRLTQTDHVESVAPKKPITSREVSMEQIPTPIQDKILVSEEAVERQIPIVHSRPPSLIEKLRAMRRLSSQTPQRSGDPKALSRYFVPRRRSSQIVADSEGESEGDGSEGNQEPPKQSTQSNVQTPEKEKPLAESFIRSPPPQGTQSSIASSPVYHPSSQPAPPGLRTELSYYVPLATLQSHFLSSVDVLAIALFATPVIRAADGPRDRYQSIYMTDPGSLARNLAPTLVQIIRSKNGCFPDVTLGDAILLRDFKVQSLHGKMSLLSTQSSAWAVFRVDTEVQIRGPPVEFGAEERAFARGLRGWWDSVTQDKRARLLEKVPKETIKKTGSGSQHSSTLEKGGKKQNGKFKKENIEGLGVELPGSQSLRKASPEVSRKESPMERSFGLDGVIESVEPPKRVLRPRGAKGVPEKSESPTKAFNRRSGTVFTGGIGEPDSE